MKLILNYILVITALIFFGSFKPHETNDELKWYGWNEGYEKAIKEGKFVLVDAYTEWCGWCKRMDRDTYSNADVIKKINQHFVPIKFNPEIEGVTYKVGDQSYNPQQLHYMLSRGESTGFPTTYYIYPKKMGIFIDPGYKDAKAFLNVLDMAIAEGTK